jgi:hypothetical protein
MKPASITPGASPFVNSIPNRPRAVMRHNRAVLVGDQIANY